MALDEDEIITIIDKWFELNKDCFSDVLFPEAVNDLKERISDAEAINRIHKKRYNKVEEF